MAPSSVTASCHLWEDLYILCYHLHLFVYFLMCAAIPIKYIFVSRSLFFAQILDVSTQLLCTSCAHISSMQVFQRK